MEAAGLLVAVPFLILAIVLSKGKGAALLAGYNTMSDKEKAQYDEAALCKFMGKIMYGISFCILLMGTSELLGQPILLFAGVGLLLGLVLFAIVYANTGNRFKKREQD